MMHEHLKFPVLTKLQFRSRGQGMAKHDTPESLRAQFDDIKRRHKRGGNQKYIEQFHNYSKEYRLHISTDLEECFYSCRKARRQGQKEYFRNSTNCVWYTQFDAAGNLKDDFMLPPNWDQITQACIDASRRIGLDLGAWDVIVPNKEPERFKILESNSAPSAAEGTGRHYRRIIPLIINARK